MASQFQRTASSRVRLLAAASELISANGSAQSSLGDIGKQAGMSRGAVNFHFGTKVALLEAVFEQASLSCRQQGRVPADLAGLFRDSHSAWFRDPTRARLITMLFAETLATQSPLLRAPMRDLSRAWREGIVGSLEHLRGLGAVRADLDLQAESAAVVAALLGLVAQARADPDFDRERAYSAFRAAATEHLEVTASAATPPENSASGPSAAVGVEPLTRGDAELALVEVVRLEPAGDRL